MTDVFPRRNLPGEAEQWGRAHDERVIALERENVTLRQSLNALNRSTAATLSNLARQLNAMPIVWVGASSQTGFGLNTVGWHTVAEVKVTVPPGKETASVVAVAGGAAADLTTGGLTTAEARIIIASSIVSPRFSAAKDSGASVVNNVISASYGVGNLSTVLVPEFTVQFQMTGLNPAAFPPAAENYASLTVTATF